MSRTCSTNLEQNGQLVVEILTVNVSSVIDLFKIQGKNDQFLQSHQQVMC